MRAGSWRPVRAGRRLQILQERYIGWDCQVSLSVGRSSMCASPSVAPETAGNPSPVPGLSTRVLFLSGVFLLFASVLVYVVQINWANLLVTPWYMPLGGTLAAILALWAFARQRRWWQAAVAVVCILMAALEWLFVGSLTVLPAYTGP